MAIRLSCPICGATEVEKKLDVEFAPGILPREYSFYYCLICDFGFCRPRELTEEILNEFYSSSERSHASDTLYRYDDYQSQLNFFENVLKLVPEMKILDFGCAEGDLLNKIHENLHVPFSNLYGYDVFPNKKAEYHHADTLASISTLKFDVIILSHVLEHLLSFDLLSVIRRFLSPTGKLFVESPNAGGYAALPRRTPGYYFDRLHINHFTINSLVALLKKESFTPLHISDSSFPYSDGLPYPVLMGIFMPKILSFDFFNETLLLDNNKIMEFKKAYAKTELIVWGVGDNFYRANSLGLFDSLHVVAVVDRNLGKKMHPHYPATITIAEALNEFPNAAVLPMMSWRVMEAIETIKSIDPGRIIIIY
jgi:SAM-dependent methyltransferase